MPRDFVLFLDENLHNCQAILQVLQEANMPHERHRDHFPPGTPDTTWLSVIGRNGWVLLTTDIHIRTRHLERAAVERFRIAMFCFSGKASGAAVMASSLSIALPTIQKLLQKQSPPFIATLTKGGEVNLRETFS